MAALDELLAQIDDPASLNWNDETYDLMAAQALTGDARATAIARLSENAAQSDPRALLTLGYMNAVEALPLLLRFGLSHEPASPVARRALVEMGHGAEVAQELANDAIGGATPITRLAALISLPKIGGKIALAALETALADDDYKVRMVAWDSIVALFGLMPLLQGPDGKREISTEIEQNRILLASDLPAMVKLGVEEMRKLADKLQAGFSPQMLGIQWAPKQATELFDQLRKAQYDDTLPFPIDDVARLTGTPRRMAEIMIAIRLENKDERVPEALALLGASWLVPVLDEVASPDSLRDKAQAAAQRLRVVN